MGPWEKYGGQSGGAAAGPWSKYSTSGPDTGPHGMLGDYWEHNPITETIGEAGYNFMGSAWDLAKGYAKTVANPIDAAQGLYEAGPSGIAKYYKDRYGSLSAGIETFKKDPAGVMADLSTFLFPLSAGARLPGAAGRVAATAGKVSAAVDPVMVAAKGAAAVGPKIASGASRMGKGAANALGKTIGVSTSVGPESIRAAARAGLESSQGNMGPATALKQHMYGEERLGGKTVSRANLAIARMKRTAGQTLESEIAPAMADKTVIPWDRVTDAIKDATAAVTVRSPVTGRLIGAPGSTDLAVVRSMTKVASEFRKLPAYEHTISTFDKMRKEMWKIADKQVKGSTERRAAMKVYNGVVKAIRETDPTGVYRAANAKYSTRIRKIQEIENTLSLGNKFKTVDTALRKLQSGTRDTAWSNMGERLQLMKEVVAAGADNLMYELAGQSLRPLWKNNLNTGLALGASGILTTLFSPYSMFTLAAVSPKIMGEAAFRAGQFAGNIVKPVVATQRVFKKYGLDPMRRAAASAGTNLGAVGRAASHGAMQAGRWTGANDQKKELRKALGDQAKAMNINIRGNVLDSVVDDLFSGDPEAYTNGIQRIGKNKRLMSLIEAAGK